MLTKHIVASLAIGAVTALGYLVDAPKAPNDFTYVGPNIVDSNGYTQKQIDQIHSASNDAVYFSKLVLDSAGNATLANATFDRVFKRYFDPKDRDFVLVQITVPGVFKAIVNTHKDPINNPSDAALALRNIHVVPDWINDRYPVHACPPGGTQNYAALREWTDPIPSLVLCARLFKHGAFPRPNAHKWIDATQPTCGSVGERVTRKMFTMGTVFVRAFTYWKYIMGPAFGGRGQGYAQELATGPVKAAQFGHEDATLNGDSYAWFATELAWTLLCNKQFGAPVEGDDADL